MPFEIREIVLQAQLLEDTHSKDKDGDGDHDLNDHAPEQEQFSTALLVEMRRMIKEELDRRARR